MVALALTSDLMGLGMAPALAQLAGDSVAAVTAVGTAQAGAAALTGTINNVTTSAGQTAVVLPSNWPLASSILVYTNSATTALVFPPSGGNINEGAANASVNVAQGKATCFVRISATKWIALAGA